MSIILASDGRQGEKEGMTEIQKFQYLENEKSFLDEIKSIFHSFGEKIKKAGTSFKYSYLPDCRGLGVANSVFERTLTNCHFIILKFHTLPFTLFYGFRQISPIHPCYYISSLTFLQLGAREYSKKNSAYEKF